MTAGLVGGRDKWRHVAMTFILVVTPLWAGCGILSPTTGCENGVDSTGRDWDVALDVTCKPSGSDIECQANPSLVGWGACTGQGAAGVIGSATWVATNSAVGVFTVPGLFHVLAPGGTAIYASILAETPSGRGVVTSSHVYGYIVDPAKTPRLVTGVRVVAYKRDAGVIPGAAISFTSETGGTQTCQQFLDPQCTFWTDVGSALVSASAAGYASAQQSVAITSTGPYGTTVVSLYLTPIAQ